MRGKFAVTLGGVVGIVALVGIIIRCYGRVGGTPPSSNERDGGLTVLEGGLQIAQAVVGFEGDCCTGGCGGASVGCGGFGT